jgi:hypothetical protein
MSVRVMDMVERDKWHNALRYYAAGSRLQASGFRHVAPVTLHPSERDHEGTKITKDGTKTVWGSTLEIREKHAWQAPQKSFLRPSCPSRLRGLFCVNAA